MTVCVPCHMDRPRVRGLRGSEAGMLFDGGAGEWGGRGGKENMGEEMVLLLCQGMPLTERGVLFYAHELCWYLKMMELRCWRTSCRLHGCHKCTRCTAACCHFLTFAVNYVLKVALRHGMCEQLSVVQPCERVKVGQLLVLFSAEVDNSWAGRWCPTWLTGLTRLIFT